MVSLIAIILMILAFLGLGFVAIEPEESVGTVAVVTEVVDEPADGWTVVEIDGVRGAIVAPEAVAGFGVSGPYWLPLEADVVAAEMALAEAEGHLDHVRQYAGFTEDGERKILVNGFCSDEWDWTREIVFVMDGGSCYFTAVYNVETQELESFQFNGEA